MRYVNFLYVVVSEAAQILQTVQIGNQIGQVIGYLRRISIHDLQLLLINLTHPYTNIFLSPGCSFCGFGQSLKNETPHRNPKNLPSSASLMESKSRYDREFSSSVNCMSTTVCVELVVEVVAAYKVTLVRRRRRDCTYHFS